ncbi:MAG: helix-hairpin-helix domain-containing protein [Chitinophagales bacterium]|nr:helix-hairpin-helix domain-containing protein [Chitinophagales bacterium]
MFRWLEKYFTFTANERRAVIALMAIAPFIYLVPATYKYLFPTPEITVDTAAIANVNAFITAYKAREAEEQLREDTIASGSEFNPYAHENFRSKDAKALQPCFSFDPNKVSIDEWIKLGFTEKQALSIEKFKAKGGKFYRPEDLQKIHVISEDMYAHLLPCVQIELPKFVKDTFGHKAHTAYIAKDFTIDIATADSALFERQKGIGPSLASRIVRYRNRLGGFTSIEQISEVWGMPDSTYQLLKPNFILSSNTVQTLNINVADMETLRKHPYINYSLARIICSYREQHGKYKSKDELLNITVITDSIFKKLEPYITVN